MSDHTVGFVEPHSRYRADAENSAGVEETRFGLDIPTRIRTLLLSRHACRPPRTPWSSDEVFSREPGDGEITTAFDFTTARSVAKIARQDSGRLSLPLKHTADLPGPPEILSISRLNRWSTLRGSSSTGDLLNQGIFSSGQQVAQISEDGALSDALLTSDDTHSQHPHMTGGLDFRPVIRKHEIESHPRKTQRGLSIVMSKNSHEVKDVISGLSNTGLRATEDVSEGNFDQQRAMQSLQHGLGSEMSVLQGNPELGASNFKDQLVDYLPEYSLGEVAQPLTIKFDIAPYADKVTSPELLDSTVASMERHLSLQNSKIRSIASYSSLQPKFHVPFFEADASTSSAHRHALLKSSITPSQPVDLGLPIKPVLTSTQQSTSLEASLDSRMYNETVHDHHKQSLPTSSLPTPQVALTSLLQSAHNKDSAFEGDTSCTWAPVSTGDNQEYRFKSHAPENEGDQTRVLNDDDTIRESIRGDVKLGVLDVKPFICTTKEQDSVPDRRPNADTIAEAAWTADEYLKLPTGSKNDLVSAHGTAVGRISVVGCSSVGRNVDMHCAAQRQSTPPADQDSAPPGHSTSPEHAGSDCLFATSFYDPMRKSSSNVANSNVTTESFPIRSESNCNFVAQSQSWKQSTNTETGAKQSKMNGRSWDIATWRHTVSRGSVRNQVGLPVRKSSMDRGTSASSKSSRNSASHHRIFEKLVSRAGPKTQSASSLGSTKTGSVLTKSLTVSETRPTNSVRPGDLDHQLSVRWLRELLSDQHNYATRFTALPPRRHRQIKDLSKAKQRMAIPIPLVSTEVKNSEPSASENFTRTINDLENLLNEALYIARKAAESEGTENESELLGDSNGRKSLAKSKVRSSCGRTALSPPLFGSRNSDGAVSLMSAHESSRSVSSDSSTDTGSVKLEGHWDLDDGVPLQFFHRSDGNVVVQPAIMPSPASTWPLGYGSVKPSSKSVRDKILSANSLLKKGGAINSPTEGVSSGIELRAVKKHSTKWEPRTLPTVRDGNTVPGLRTEKEIWPHSTKDEQNTLEQDAIAEEPSQNPRVSRNPRRERSRRPGEKTHRRAAMNKREVSDFIKAFRQPPIQPRHGSLTLRKTTPIVRPVIPAIPATGHGESMKEHDSFIRNSRYSLSQRTISVSAVSETGVELDESRDIRQHAATARTCSPDQVYELKDSSERDENLPRRHISGYRLQDKLHSFKHDKLVHLNLRGKSHVSIRGHREFSLSKSHRRQPIARDWSPGRKRFAASTSCVSTALIGILIGIYAGEVPSIQYYIADFSHYAILGNVFFFIGLAISTFLFWPLPLLHGRKPYVLTAMTIAMPLLFPQAMAVGLQRSPYVATYRVGLILPRAFMGLALGFANMNLLATLTDLFGASLQSANPHQETVDEFDVRRHGGGLGVWLGIWTWCYIGSIGIGFMIGAVVINDLSPDWGFYVSIVIIAAVLLLNVITPEVRRSTFRRSVTEVITGERISRRLARGEVMMHRLQTGPRWWGEEFHQGVMLSLDMMRQPGFLVMSFYVAWMYGQIVMVIVLLGSLMSKYYRFTSPIVGLTTMAIPFGALLAIPFQKASLFSRARRHPQRTDSGTFERRISWSSHLVRRAIFTLVLPFAGLAYTLCSGGPPTPFILPVLFAGLIGFLSNLAIAECNGIIMEAFDTSDLQPGMTGRPRGRSGERTQHKRTNYSSFPRISSAFAITQSLGFLIGAVATGVGGAAERQLGQMAATGVMAGILLILTTAFLGVLLRWKVVQIVPTHRQVDLENWERERQHRIKAQEQAATDGVPFAGVQVEAELEPWRPVIIGNPSGKTRRMSILELGHLSRWSEIRRRNRLVDELSYEARHPNLTTLEDVRREIRDKQLGNLHRGGSKRSQRSRLSQRSQLSYGSEGVGGESDGGDLGERKL